MKTYNEIDLGSIKFVVYIRKSSEGDERQALSPENQRKVIEQITERYEIKNKQIIEVFEEAHSAKKPGERPLFNKLVKGVENGVFDGILTWQPSRISRNPVDAGSIVNLMDKKLLKIIITAEKLYENAIPMDKFWFGFQCMQAKLENDDRGISSRGGMLTKAKKGWMPSAAPLGYKNTPLLKKDYKEMVVDKERFPLVQRLFTEIIGGKQAIEVYREACKEWKLTSQRGTILSQSAFYNLLTKPFYYGEFEWPKGSSDWYKGKHKAMITREEFDMVQVALGKRGRPIARSHTFDLTGLFRCSECGCAITASQKIKHYKGTGRTVTYTYYHCTKKNKNKRCNSKPLTEADMMAQINKVLAKVRPDQEFIAWAKKWLSAMHLNESAFQEETLKSQQKALLSLENKLNKLLDALLKEVIDDESYKSKKIKLEAEKREIQDKIDNTGNKMEGWRGKVENALDFAYGCQYRFNNGTRADKQEIMMRLGSDLILNNTKLLEITLKKEYGVLANKRNWKKKYKGWLEPQVYTDFMEKSADLRPASPCWLPREDSDLEPADYK